MRAAVRTQAFLGKQNCRGVLTNFLRLRCEQTLPSSSSLPSRQSQYSRRYLQIQVPVNLHRSTHLDFNITKQGIQVIA